MEEKIKELRIILREKDIPFFEDDELEYYLEKNAMDVNKTAYECLLVKAEGSTLAITGLTLSDTSTYFRRLAQKYRPNNSGVLKGVY